VVARGVERLGLRVWGLAKFLAPRPVAEVTGVEGRALQTKLAVEERVGPRCAGFQIADFRLQMADGERGGGS
jgi:hypothetical protein